MGQKASLFSTQDQAELKAKLQQLKNACCPDVASLMPHFEFVNNFLHEKEKHALTWGPIINAYKISPHELKGIWEDRETLNASCVDFIQVKGQRWFYNTQEIAPDFFSQDGQQMVSVIFPFFMDAEFVWNVPGAKKAMANVLRQCHGGVFPSDVEAQKCFSEDLLRRIYKRNYSRASIEMSVLELMEVLRRKVAEYVLDHHVSEILKSSNFINYVSSRVFPQNTPEIQKAREYLAAHKQAAYVFGAKVGLIRHAAKMMRYEQMRDHVRHAENVPSLPISPQQIYKDFEEALFLETDDIGVSNSQPQIEDQSDLAYKIDMMSCILNILKHYENPKLKKKKSAYWLDLVQKGIVEPSEVADLQKMHLSCNNVAHVNPGIDKAKEVILDDTRLTDIYLDISTRHEEKMARLLEKQRS